MNKFKNIFLILLGLIIITNTLFNRFLSERIPHELTFEYNTFKLITLIIIVFISIIALINKLRKLFNKDNNNKWIDNKVMQSFFKVFEIIQKSLDKVLEILLNYEIINSILFKISKLLFPLIDYTRCVSFLVPLSRIVVASTFFIDVCIFNTFNHFYKTVPLLILPMVISSIVYMFKFWANQMRQEIQEVITVKKLKFVEIDGVLNKNVKQLIIKIQSKEQNDHYFLFEYRKDINTKDKDKEPGDLYVYKNMFFYSLLLLDFERYFNENADEKWFFIPSCISKLLFIICWIYIIIKMVQ